ncbi:HD domain-containing protein [Candidatus Bathyarchaeota archaeon]|nr:HD domain-containing protein [Candidatus Bathyarchaeota archaeon]
MEENELKILKMKAKKFINDYGCHGFEHIERVYLTCLLLGKKNCADLSVLLPAAILHDVGRRYEKHAEESGRIALEILKELGLDEEKQRSIINTILAHSFTGNRIPDTLESKILSDADKLDAMGAIGIYRASMYSYEYKLPIEDFVNHFYEKLLKLKDLMHTSEGKKLAELRLKFMLQFLNEMEKEMKLEA